MNIQAPLITQLELTNKCNLRCAHCYRLDPEYPALKGTESDEETILFLAAKIADAKLFDVVLTGGEPLVKKHLVRRLIKYFKNKNMYVSLNTNLLLLDKDFLRDIRDLRLDGLLISCPSCEPSLYKQMTGNGDYFRFENNLKMVIAERMHFSVNMVVNKSNLHSIRDTASHLRSLGVERFGATPMGLNVERPELDLFLQQQEIGQLIKDLLWVKEKLQMRVDIFEAIPKCIFPEEIHQKELHFLKRKCQAGRTAMAIANNGDVRPCAHNPNVYGNLCQESLEVIWNRMADWRTDTFIPEKCGQCKVLRKCLGGCRTTAKAFAGNWKCEDPWMKLPLSSDTFKKVRVDFCPSLNANNWITPSKIRWRKEGNNYLICTKTIRNAMLVNENLFRFTLELQKLSEIQLSKLAELCGVPFTNTHFQRTIKRLLEKNFISMRERR